MRFHRGGTLFRVQWHPGHRMWHLRGVSEDGRRCLEGMVRGTEAVVPTVEQCVAVLPPAQGL